MITIIHGDDTVLSRNFLLESQQKDKNFVSLSGANLIISDLAQNIQGTALFAQTKTIVIENFLTHANKKGKDVKEIADFINRNEKKVNIFFWEGKELGKRDLSVFPKAAISQFKLPKALFSFLDNLAPGNFKSSIIFFHKALEQSAEELIFFMLMRQFRLLLALSQSHPEQVLGSQIDEAVRLAPWQRQKLERQASRFTVDKLKQIYEQLYEIEIAQRTGTLALSLAKSIDFFILSI